jgi:hypothetical protein
MNFPRKNGEEMTTTMLDSLSTLMRIRRWNLLPRVETWMESENIAYFTHLAYAIAREGQIVGNQAIEHLLIRCLLKSFNKYLISDVSVEFRDELKQIDKSATSPESAGDSIANLTGYER